MRTIVDLLLACGADFSLHPALFKIPLETAFIAACRMGHKETIIGLLKRGTHLRDTHAGLLVHLNAFVVLKDALVNGNDFT